MVTEGRLALVGGRPIDFKLLAALVNPHSQFGEVIQRQLLDGLLNFLNVAHARKITRLRRKTSPVVVVADCKNRGQILKSAVQ
jgi:hypothetical protein